MDIEWSLVRAFLAVAEEGSLSGAARRLGASQPTLGRQIKQIEAALEVELFQRQPRGLTLTDTGTALLPAARRMRDAMQDIALTAAGQQEQLAGTVRITASVVLSTHTLPPIIAEIRSAHPEIAIELAPSDSTRNLIYREADIAVRMYRPTQLELITRHIGDLPLALFGSPSYIARRGMPTAETLHEHDIVGYDRDTRIIEGMAEAGLPVTREDFPVRCDDQNAYLAMIRAGCGIGFAQDGLMSRDGMQRIDIDYPIPPLPIWLTAHATMRQTPRVRRVWDMLAEGLGRLVA